MAPTILSQAIRDNPRCDPVLWLDMDPHKIYAEYPGELFGNLLIRVAEHYSNIDLTLQANKYRSEDTTCNNISARIRKAFSDRAVAQGKDAREAFRQWKDARRLNIEHGTTERHPGETFDKVRNCAIQIGKENHGAAAPKQEKVRASSSKNGGPVPTPYSPAQLPNLTRRLSIRDKKSMTGLRPAPPTSRTAAANVGNSGVTRGPSTAARSNGRVSEANVSKMRFPNANSEHRIIVQWRNELAMIEPRGDILDDLLRLSHQLHHLWRNKEEIKETIFTIRFFEESCSRAYQNFRRQPEGLQTLCRYMVGVTNRWFRMPHKRRGTFLQFVMSGLDHCTGSPEDFSDWLLEEFRFDLHDVNTEPMDEGS